ncbi:hypothetical protein D3C80_1555990 [compost metagenome]
MLIFTFKAQGITGSFECHGNEVTNGFCTVGCQHEGIRLLSLQHTPHAFDIFFGKAPVAFGIHVTQFQHVQFAQFNFGNGVSNFTGNKLTATQRRLMVKQNAA